MIFSKETIRTTSIQKIKKIHSGVWKLTLLITGGGKTQNVPPIIWNHFLENLWGLCTQAFLTFNIILKDVLWQKNRSNKCFLHNFQAILLYDTYSFQYKIYGFWENHKIYKSLYLANRLFKPPTNWHANSWIPNMVYLQIYLFKISS